MTSLMISDVDARLPLNSNWVILGLIRLLTIEIRSAIRLFGSIEKQSVISPRTTLTLPGLKFESLKNVSLVLRRASTGQVLRCFSLMLSIFKPVAVTAIFNLSSSKLYELSAM